MAVEEAEAIKAVLVEIVKPVAVAAVVEMVTTEVLGAPAEMV